MLRSFRKHINNMLLLILEAENNNVEAPILLIKSNHQITHTRGLLLMLTQFYNIYYAFLKTVLLNLTFLNP